MSLNLAVAFRNLLPRRPLLVGTVISAASEASTVQLPGGAEIVVRGTGAVGSKVFVRDGSIEGPAPSLPVVTIEV